MLKVVEGNITKEVITKIRLGEALKTNQQYKEALEIFDEAFNQCIQHKSDSLHRFCPTEIIEVDSAIRCYDEALEN